jgi:hypothetical protein
MAHSLFKITFATVAAIGTAFSFSQGTLAMTQLSADELQASFVKETQHVVVIGDEVVVQGSKAQKVAIPLAPSHLPLDALFFTMDDNGKGYCIRTQCQE